MTPFFIALQFLTRLKIVNQTEWSVEDFGSLSLCGPYYWSHISYIIWRIIAIYSDYAIDVNYRCG